MSKWNKYLAELFTWFSLCRTSELHAPNDGEARPNCEFFITKIAFAIEFNGNSFKHLDYSDSNFVTDAIEKQRVALTLLNIWEHLKHQKGSQGKRNLFSLIYLILSKNVLRQTNNSFLMKKICLDQEAWYWFCPHPPSMEIN